jgi:hypothetical protein
LNEKKLLETIEENLDKLKRIQISKIKHLREHVLNFYKDGNLLDDKILLTSFYMGYREYPKCLNDTCENQTNWLINKTFDLRGRLRALSVPTYPREKWFSLGVLKEDLVGIKS